MTYKTDILLDGVNAPRRGVTLVTLMSSAFSPTVKDSFRAVNLFWDRA